MDIFSKINHIASAASGMATGAFELGKLNLKLTAEEKRITETTAKIGECLLFHLDEGQTYEEPIMSLYEDVLASRAAILALKAQVANLNGNLLCTACQTENTKESKFCKECGAKLDEQEPIIAELVEEEDLCTACGAVLPEDGMFCTACGKKREDIFCCCCGGDELCCDEDELDEDEDGEEVGDLE